MSDFFDSKIIDAAKRFKTLVIKKSINEFLDLKVITDGLYQIEIDGPPLCVLIKNSELKRKLGLLCFHGALSKNARKNNFVPNFAGINIASNFDMAFLSISDPSLFLKNDLYLSWFSGNRYTNIQDIVVLIVNKISEKLGCKFLAFGGSGGGFASLLYASRCSSITKAFVWNPQTNISEYSVKFWKDFSLYCFDKNVKSKVDFYQLMTDYQIIHDLSKLEFDGKDVLYIQNSSDWHKENHALPFAEKKLKLNKDFYEKNNFLMIFGNWGDGHVVPPNEIIINVIKKMRDDTFDKCYFLSLIENNKFYPSNQDRIGLSHDLNEISVSKSGDGFLFNLSESYIYKFAIYFLNKNLELKKFPYKSKYSINISKIDLQNIKSIKVYKKEVNSGVVSSFDFDEKDLSSLSKDIFPFRVCINVCDNILIAKIEKKLDLKYNSLIYNYAFYLMKGRERIYFVRYNEIDNFEFKVNDSGQYRVIGFVKNIATEGIEYRSTDEYFIDLEFMSGLYKKYKAIVRGDYSDLRANGFKPRLDCVPIDVFSNFDWDVKDRNLAVSIQALRFLSPIWQKFFDSKDTRYLREVESLLDRWLNDSLKKIPSSVVWYDMSVGIRSQHLSLFLDLSKYYSVNKDLLRRVKDCAYIHLMNLCDEKKLGVGNHLFYQILGLFGLINALKIDDSEQHNYAKKLLKNYVDKSFDGNFVNLENSPFYHKYNVTLLQLLPEFYVDEIFNEIRKIVKNGNLITKWLTSPQGDFYRIGDTEGKGVLLNASDLHSEKFLNNQSVIYKDLGASGYQIIRSHPNCKSEESFSLVFRGAPGSNIHSHCDVLSFVFIYNGTEIFADPGKFIYEYGDQRNWFISDVSHNTAGLKNYPFYHKDIVLDATLIFPIEVREDVGFYFVCGKTKKSNNFSHERHIELSVNNKLIVKDFIENTTNEKTEIRYILGLDVEFEYIGNLVGFVKNKNSGERFKVLFSGDVEKISVFGKNNEKAWISNVYAKKENTGIIVVECSGESIFVEMKMDLYSGSDF